MADVKYAECEVWVIVDEDGDYSAGDSEDQAIEAYTGDYREFDGSFGVRRVKVTVRVPIPALLEVSADIPCVEAAPTVRIS